MFFIQALILKCGENKEELKAVMGLKRVHHDITVPQMHDYEFKHFKFGMGTPQQNGILQDSVFEFVKQHAKVAAVL